MRSPLQNRIHPNGSVHAVAARGMFMGNRGGKVHDPATKTLMRREWASRRWICCVTQYKDWHREVMGNGYTEFFFLDEVTALAAGHRPCALCRRPDYRRFQEAWRKAHGLKTPPSADAMDLTLHRERAISGVGSWSAESISPLPDGATVCVGTQVYAVRAGEWLRWSFEGYQPVTCLASTDIRILTPPAILDVLRQGYAPVWHPSANHTTAI